MAQGKLSAFTKLSSSSAEKEPPIGPAEGPGVGIGSSSGGGKLSALDALQKLGTVAGKKVGGDLANRGFSALTDYLFPAQLPNQGSDPRAFQAQRTGEQQDQTGAMPQTNALPPMPQDVASAMPMPNVWQAGNPTENALTVDPSQIFGSEAGQGIEQGSSALSNQAGGLLNEGGEAASNAFSNIGTSVGDYLQGLAGPAGAGIPGLLLAAASPFIKSDRDNQMLMETVGGGLTAATAALSSNPYTAILASIIKTGLGVYGDVEGHKSIPNITLNAIARSSPWGLVGGEGMTESIDNAFLPSEAWRNFTRELNTNEGQQGRGFGILEQALPYVQNQQELGELLNSVKNYVTTTTGAPLTGGRDDIYGVQTIPGTSGYEHGTRGPTAGQRVDWGPATTGLQNIIDQYKSMLPGQPLTLNYNQGGGLTGEPGMRLFSQFMDRASLAPKYSLTGWGGTDISTGAGEGGGSTTPVAGFDKGFIRPDASTSAYAPPGSIISYGDANYPYEDPGAAYGGANFPKPGETMGTVNPAWAKLMGNTGFSSLGTNSSTTAPAGAGSTGGLGQRGNNLLGTLGFAGLAGPLNEIRGGDNPNQV